MNNEVIVINLSWDDLYLEVQKGNVSMDEFLDYMVNTSKESYNEGFDEGCNSFSFATSVDTGIRGEPQ